MWEDALVIRQPIPFGFRFHPPSFPRRLQLALGVSLALHVAVGAYLAYMRFNPPAEAPPAADPIIQVPIIDWPIARPEPLKPAASRPQLHAPVVRETPEAPLAANPAPPPTAVVQAPSITPPPTLAAPQTIPPPAEPHVVRPDWRRLPTPDQLARVYPERAKRMGITGQATLSCLVGADGGVRDCRVTAETPAGQGFGEAAMKLTRYFQMRPQTVDGTPVEGGRVQVPIRFSLD
jgi:protein TonB